MKTEIKELIEISQFYGKQLNFTIAGGGNTSYKDDSYLYVKASGSELATLSKEQIVKLDRKKLKEINTKNYSSTPFEREEEVKTDLFRSNTEPEKNLRPSVETLLHDIIDYSYVVHTHPTIVNGLLCSQEAEKKYTEIFNGETLFVKFHTPGYILFKAVKEKIEAYRAEKGQDPKIIFLENHGVFVSSNELSEIKKLYEEICTKVEKNSTINLDKKELEVPRNSTEIVPAIRMMLSTENIKIARAKNSTLIQYFAQNKESFSKVEFPFTPDNIIYSKSTPLFIEKEGTPEEIIADFEQKLNEYRQIYKYDPSLVLIKNIGLIALGNNYKQAQNNLLVFENVLEISYYSENFGGPKFMYNKAEDFVDNWEIDAYRGGRVAGKEQGRVGQKIMIVTGGAQGFGGGIVAQAVKENANVIIADLNAEKGNEYAQELNEKGSKNKVICVQTDVANEESVQNLIYQTVKEFGGLDVFISNAGILRAGSLDEMDYKTFELMTKVNYMAYFVCAKYASKVMKLQAKYKADYYTDIIQVNSKSGLKGSNKNFAYAGGKFGGIGLTQSFALELMPHKIKVNSICPGNFFEGPLWSDPEKGLFVQYLRAGKVPGAKTIEDVKQFYEGQVPAKRGCWVIDVMRAIYYVIEQEYETGQAIPVTGGQIMLK